MHLSMPAEDKVHSALPASQPAVRLEHAVLLWAFTVDALACTDADPGYYGSGSPQEQSASPGSLAFCHNPKAAGPSHMTHYSLPNHAHSPLVDARLHVQAELVCMQVTTFLVRESTKSWSTSGSPRMSLAMSPISAIASMALMLTSSCFHW